MPNGQGWDIAFAMEIAHKIFGVKAAVEEGQEEDCLSPISVCMEEIFYSEILCCHRSCREGNNSLRLAETVTC